MNTETPPAGKLDASLPFIPVRIAVLTVSDTRDEESDTSGRVLAERIVRDGHIVAERDWVKDNADEIRARLRSWGQSDTVDVIISTGGTGLTGKDVTPEAVRPLFEKEIEGFQAVWHKVSYETVGLSTLQSRACAGLINGKFIFCLPGSNGACKDGWDEIIRWQLDRRYRPCNLVELMPRLMER